MAKKKKAKRKTTRTTAKKKTAKKKTAKKKVKTAKRGRSGTKGRGGASSGTSRRRKQLASDQANTDTSGQAPAPGGGQTGGPNGIRVRMYRVGFGDFFLLTLQTSSGPKHILIDCGVHACDAKSIEKAVDHMAAETGRQLSVVIMTHRHADHISGFARCKEVFSQFTVGKVWMSWLEDPADSKAQAFQANLALVADQMQKALAVRNRPEDDELDFMAENITGNGGGSNAVALKVLHGGFKNKIEPKYYQAGQTPELPDDLIAAGLTAKVLGPPHDRDLIKQMNGKNEQFLAASEISLSGPVRPFMDNFCIRSRDYQFPPIEHYKQKEVERTVLDSQPDMLAAKATQADNTLNNQSLVVLFSYKGKNLLFAGDAQWGNWENFLYGGQFGAAGHTKLTDESQKILSSLDFYKVGHHGSTNATPKDALNAMREGLVAMCSTQPGCYGSEKSGTEVPRIPLLEALDKKTDHQLARSDQIKVGDTKPSDGLSAPGKPFTTPGDLYIDYNL